MEASMELMERIAYDSRLHWIWEQTPERETAHYGERVPNKYAVYRKYEGDDEARFHITTPKTSAGTRIIPMLSDVKKALLTEYNLQQEFGFCDENIDGYTGFIFQNRYGSLFSAHDINRAIERIYKAHNEHETQKAVEENRQPLLIRHFSVHNLRHTFCTRFCENESNLKVIQEIMGHADIETTMNIYAEATAQKKQESFCLLLEVLENQKERLKYLRRKTHPWAGWKIWLDFDLEC